MSESDWTRKTVVKLVLRIGLLVVLVAALGMAGCPYYGVYHQHMEGMAQLAKAEYSKQVLVQDAKAREEAAKSLAAAEVTRAEGVAKANKIIGESLQHNEAYLHYLWIHNLEAGAHDVIYVPTEAGLPIFEAGGRFHKREREKPKPGAPGTAEHPDVETGERQGERGDGDAR
jgi:hypothetical protein